MFTKTPWEIVVVGSPPHEAVRLMSLLTNRSVQSLTARGGAPDVIDDIPAKSGYHVHGHECHGDSMLVEIKMFID